MTDHVSTSPSPATSASSISQSSLFTLSEKARQFGLNPDRPFFPVNSLRLLYFLLLESMTTDKEAIDKMDRFIPKVEAFLSGRITAHTTLLSPAKELEECQPLITEIKGEIDDFHFTAFLEELFTTTFPLHDLLLVSLSQRMTTHSETITDADLELLLQCRAMDSIVFAEILKHLLQRYATGTENEAASLEIQRALPWILQKVYMLNDMVDCVVFAKDDMASEAFSPLSFVRLIAPEPQEAKALIKTTVEKALNEKTAFPVPEKVGAILELFFNGLNSIIMG